MADHRTEEAATYRRLYKTARWQRLRTSKLTLQPLCERCLAMEVIVSADVVHHRTAHRGNEDLFWSMDNLESLCKPHHDSEGAREDRGQTIVTFGADGWPVE